MIRLVRFFGLLLCFNLFFVLAPEVVTSYAQGGSVSNAEKIIIKQRRQKAKRAKVAHNSAIKAHWARQSKASKKTIKRANRRNRKLMRLKRKANRERKRLSGR